MSSTHCEIVATGALVTLQDAGRFGRRRLGVPWSGCLIDAWRRLGCRLVGNADDSVVLEAFEAGLRIKAIDGPLRVAALGDVVAERVDPQGATLRVPAWQSLTLAAGDALWIRDSGRARVALVAVHGLDAPSVLDSRSTYTRAGLGGPHGGPLQAGDRLLAVAATGDTEWGLVNGDERTALALAGLGASGGHNKRSGRDANGGGGSLKLRAMAGPQDDHFDADQLTAFFAEARWTVGANTDRMGARLAGEPLVHRWPSLADIVSDAILPGSVQVPASGEPIVMLSDAHTLGGYPKIATVIGADRPVLALARPGAPIRFVRVDEAAAVSAARQQRAQLDALLDRIAPARREPDTTALLASNLIDGVVDARQPDESPAR